VLDSNQRPAD